MRKSVKVKPGKGQSILGMVVGSLFCLLGLVIVIPNFGFFGIIWTLVALCITIVNGIHVFSDKGIMTREIIIEEETERDFALEQAKKGEQKRVAERLEMVKRLYEEGSITKEEFDQKRKKILDEI